MQPSGKDDVLRLLRFLLSGEAALAGSAQGARMLLTSDKGTVSAMRSTVATVVGAALIERSGGKLRLTQAGRAFAAGGNRTKDVIPEGIGERELIRLGDQTILTDHAESPLAQLMRRRTAAGRPFLEATEFEAGERLRSDYTRGQIMPRLGANWTASVSSGRRAGGAADITDAAMTARIRVEKAIVAVGPELSGVLIDVCCYLKGLERVESERGWPVRSAKIVLKSALGVLGRHYDPRTPAAARPKLLHWGTADYRPRIDPCQ